MRSLSWASSSPVSPRRSSFSCFAGVPGDAVHSLPLPLHSQGSDTLMTRPPPCIDLRLRVYDAAVAPIPVPSERASPGSRSTRIRVLLASASSPIPVHFNWHHSSISIHPNIIYAFLVADTSSMAQSTAFPLPRPHQVSRHFRHCSPRAAIPVLMVSSPRARLLTACQSWTCRADARPTYKSCRESWRSVISSQDFIARIS
jgi:hypothetical protein